MTRRTTRLILPALTIALALGACQRNPFGGQSGGGDSQTMTIDTEKGATTIRNGVESGEALPAGFALYPGAKLITSTALTAEGKENRSGMVGFETSDSTDKVVAFYKDAAQRAGYQVENEIVMPDMAMIGGKKAGAEPFQLIVNNAQGKSTATFISGGG
jgi:hypothetical protein